MASDTHASYAKIGFTVFVGIVAIVASLIYLGGLRDNKDFILAETYFDKPVSGLSVGSVVNFRGVKLGEVREITFVGTQYADASDRDMSRIYVLMALNTKMINPARETFDIEATLKRFVLQRGMRASVSINGITGLSRVELNYTEGEEVEKVPELSWQPKHVYIPSKDSLIDSFSVAATKVMNQIKQMDLNTFWSNLNASVMSVSHCAASADAMIASRQADVERLLGDMTATTESFRELADLLRQNPSVLVRGVERQPLEETAR